MPPKRPTRQAKTDAQRKLARQQEQQEEPEEQQLQAEVAPGPDRAAPVKQEPAPGEKEKATPRGAVRGVKRPAAGGAGHTGLKTEPAAAPAAPPPAAPAAAPAAPAPAAPAAAPAAAAAVAVAAAAAPQQPAPAAAPLARPAAPPLQNKQPAAAPVARPAAPAAPIQPAYVAPAAAGDPGAAGDDGPDSHPPPAKVRIRVRWTDKRQGSSSSTPRPQS